MLTVDNVGTARRERLIRGRDTWWFLGPGGIAKVRPDRLDADGNLLPETVRFLQDAGLFNIKPYTSYALTVLTSTDCNLGCNYCFQNVGQDLTGGNRPPRIAHARLTAEIVENIGAFTARQMTAGGFDKLTLMLFGGEPLLNLKGCRLLLSTLANHGLVSAQMTTNGVLLTPLVARELCQFGLKSVQISFDGDREEHDRSRVRRAGGGTFDTIVENMARSTEASPVRWDIRVNVTHLNRASIDGLIERLATRLDTSRCAIYFARVGDVGIGFANELRHELELAKDFIRWNRRSLELGFRITRPTAVPACRTCSYKDGRYGAVVNPDGQLYSCWQTSGKPGWEVGTTTSGYLPQEHTDGRWETCEGRFQFSEAALLRQAFRDIVDAAVLDDLATAGKL